MRHTKSIISFLLVGLVMSGLVTSPLHGQTKVGTTSASFLGISVGPRATAMGGAFAAVSSDASALYYNPGGITRFGTSQVMIAHTRWLVDTDFNWIGIVLNLDGTNAIGISFTQLGYGEEEVTTVFEPEGTGDVWAATDMAFALTYARNLTDRFSIGGSVKYIQQTIWNESSNAFAMDVGLQYLTGFNDMKLGMSITNFGTEMQMEGKDLLQRVDLDPDAIGHNENIVGNLKTESWPLPLFFRVGVSMDVLNTATSRLTVAVDALRPTDNDESLNVGGEYGFREMVYLRGGYKSLFRDDSEEGLTAGVGIRLDQAGLGYGIDYTYADFGYFEEIHMVSLGISF